MRPHHLTRRSDGGPTVLHDLLLCRRHHVLWHQGELHLQHLHVPWRPDRAGRHAQPLDDPLPAGP